MVNNYQLPRIIRSIDGDHLAPYKAKALDVPENNFVEEGREEHPTVPLTRATPEMIERYERSIRHHFGTRLSEGYRHNGDGGSL